MAELEDTTVNIIYRAITVFIKVFVACVLIVGFVLAVSGCTLTDNLTKPDEDLTVGCNR